ncbi:MAG TPA: hypothetical protein VNU97_20155 [Rhizomicrobium sp.]|jgi:hypothetical protein|nr:hypothetical protein [Rhizomicrobium sp.]
MRAPGESEFAVIAVRPSRMPFRARRKFGVAVGVQLWGFTGDVVWTDSVQGVRENNFRRDLSNSWSAQSREERGEMCEAASISLVVQCGERQFVAAKINVPDDFSSSPLRGGEGEFFIPSPRR